MDIRYIPVYIAARLGQRAEGSRPPPLGGSFERSLVGEGRLLGIGAAWKPRFFQLEVPVALLYLKNTCVWIHKLRLMVEVIIFSHPMISMISLRGFF